MNEKAIEAARSLHFAAENIARAYKGYLQDRQTPDVLTRLALIEDEMKRADAALSVLLALPPPRAREEIARELRFYGGNGETESQACMLRTANYLTFHPEDDVRWAVNVLLETIAARFEANETWDVWKSDAAALVRSFKHDLSSTAGQDQRDLDEVCAACGESRREHITPGGTRYGPTTLCGVFIPRELARQEWRDISSTPKGDSLAEKLRRRADEHEAKGDRKSKIIADELRAWAAEIPAGAPAPHKDVVK